jgi:hypothetical protein
MYAPATITGLANNEVSQAFGIDNNRNGSANIEK